MSESPGPTPTPRARYRPISDYGVVGDGRTAALIATDGSIDWWCPSRFDAPSVFAAILDKDLGGHFRLAPAHPAVITSRYLPDTNVLETMHRTSDAEVTVIDYAPHIEDSGTDDAVIVRTVRCGRGSMTMAAQFEPRFNYGRIAPRFSTTEHGILARGGGQCLLLTGVAPSERVGSGRHGTFVIREGERVDIVLRHSPIDRADPFPDAAIDGADMEARTIRRWQTWAAATRIDGPDAEAVRRSALTLKLLQFSPTGAIVAAPTTSLPEAIGGVRNWDYRYTWIRDAAFSARALFAIGHEAEAERFVSWLMRRLGTDAGNLRVLYSVTGEADLPERELDHLDGYRSSRPVRIGNDACSQHQLDMYGELLDTVHACRQCGFDVESPNWKVLQGVVKWVQDNWRNPDQGIWEMRCAPRHFVLSKAMAWAAFDRATRAAREGDLPGAADEWEAEAEVIRNEVLERGWSDELGAFQQAYDFPHLDASNLLLPIIGFIDANDPRMVRTVNRTMEVLTVDGLVYRYINAGDGIQGGEATFTYCTFWLIEVLALQGRVAEARALLDQMKGRATHLGLYAEELDPITGEHLGNFPQGFPHIGLINAALAIRNATTRDTIPGAPPQVPAPG